MQNYALSFSATLRDQNGYYAVHNAHFVVLIDKKIFRLLSAFI